MQTTSQTTTSKAHIAWWQQAGASDAMLSRSLRDNDEPLGAIAYQNFAAHSYAEARRAMGIDQPAA